MSKSAMFLIAGPSGSGQDSVIAEAIKQGLKCVRVITSVTRAKRAGESEGQPYHFLSQAEFEDGLKAGDFLEHAEYNGHLYGVRQVDLAEAKKTGWPVIWKVDHQGIKNVKQFLPEVRAILIKPASLEELKARLIKRGQNSAEDIEARLKIASQVLSETEIYDFVIENHNGELPLAGQKLKEIIENNLSR